MLCQNKNIDLQSIVPITVITITYARGSCSRCWRCCSPLRGSSRRRRRWCSRKAKTAAIAAADKKSAGDFHENSHMDVGE